MRRNKFDEAIQIFNLGTLLKIKNTDYSLIYQLIGESYAKKGNKDIAILYYTQAVAQDAGNKVAQGFLTELTKK
jgi:predicted negative regulator of RcsB-dependent stress response